MKILKLLLFFFVIFLTSCEFSKSYQCSGYVYDIDTNEPIERVFICIDPKDYYYGDCEYTDKNGSFWLYADSVGYLWPFMSPPKEIYITASKPGYKEIEIEYADYVEIYLEKDTN